MSDDSPAPAHKWPERLRELVVRWVGWSHDHYAIVLATALALTTVAGIFAWKLLHNVETDFATLLPDKDRSVQDLRETRRRYGGTASVSILIASPDFSANAQFATALADRLLETKESAGIRDVRYKEGPEREFLEKNKFLYADLEDLKTIHKRLKARIKWERCAKNPFCIQLDEKPEFTVDDIEEKYRKQIGDDTKRNRDGFLSNADGTILALDVDVQAVAGRFGSSRILIKRLREEIAKLDPTGFHPEMEVGLWGSLVKGLYEYDRIIGEAVQTAGLSILLVFAVVFFYFRRFRPVLFMSLSVIVAILWTFALTWWRIGYLNQQTAFLGSIIVGNGINFSIIFMARYLEERARGTASRPALLEAARTTVGATATAAGATAIAYGVLLVASFKGFSQFGFMGAIGMLFCWVATFTLCPPLLALGERVRPFVSKANVHRAEEGTFGTKYLGGLVERSPGPVIATGVLLTILAVFGSFRLFKEPFEYDFARLRLQIQHSEQQTWAVRHFEVFSRGRSDALVVVTDSAEQSRLAAQALEKKRTQPDSTIERIWWLGSLVPEDQNQKLEVLGKIKDLVDTQPIGWMNDKQRLKVEEFKASLSLDPIRLEKVPPRLVEKLQEKDGTVGRVVLIYPKKEVRLSDGRELIRFANEIRKIDLEDGTTLWTSGSPVIFADMLASVIKDGRLTTIVCYLAVTVALFASFRSLRTTAFIMVFLTYGLILLAGAMGFLGLKVNFFNYIVIPITVGIGVDYHINVYKRYELDGKKSIRSAVVQTGGAVILCSLTTIIGYGSMLLSATPAMVSFGLMAVIGEITCLTSALLLKPAFLVVGERRRIRAIPEKAGGAT